MAGRILILGGGTVDYAFAKEYIHGQEFDTIACADSGLDAAKKLGLDIDFLLGDFDSVQKDTLKGFMEENALPGSNTKFARYPAKKDYTDMHLILEWAVSQKPSGIIILGATGGRLDHLIANINILMLPLANNIPAYIVDRNNKLCLAGSRHIIKREESPWKYISVYPLTDKVTGVSLAGVKYPLEDVVLEKGGSTTVSNEFAADASEAVISLDTGILIVIQSDD
ncbi:MAG: thiamine diphosphokinase [Lachnospiraceae bacterium]|nr:thiamine diphosphokinase [Lachnospiraceae bacterium]